MIQFTEEQILDFRNRGSETQAMIDWLLKETKLLREHELVIPKTGCATWQLYYFCPDCSVKLEFDLDSPKQYRCPSCHKYFSGEPYEGAWWRWLNTFNYTSTYYLSLLYMLTGEKKYADRVKEVILTYAKYYPDYEVHGDIPYNQPGRANSQALDEALFLRYYATSYDLIGDTLTEEEKEFIKVNLFKIGADFLREHRTDQLHNHEVDIDASMAILGIVLGDEELVNHALYEKYGLYYQLENGMLSDGMWFECSSVYHSFALMNFFSFEKFALHTKWSHANHPNYKKMLLFSTNLLKSDFYLPLLNDCMRHISHPDAYEIYEFAYSVFKEDLMLAVLQNKYEKQPRCNLESFFYGVKELPAEKVVVEHNDYHDEAGSGITAWHRTGDQYLIMKHGPYGGEHDHYDKLELSYMVQSKPVFEDLGTTGYGAYLHYNYFKNTISHNTITVNESNQPPCRGVVRDYCVDEKSGYIDAQASWGKTFEVPDSFIIKQWDEEAYEGVVMNRKVVFTDDYIVDVQVVTAPEVRKFDNSLHFGGKLVGSSVKELKSLTQTDKLGDKAPYDNFINCAAYQADKDVWASFALEDLITDVYFKKSDAKIVFTEAPGNPSNVNIPYVMERAEGKKQCFAHVFSTRHDGEEKKVSDVAFVEDGGKLKVSLVCKGKTEEYIFDLED